MRTLALILVSLLFGAVAAADPIPANATADQVLDALNARGHGLRDFSADVNMTEVSQSTGDSSSHTGTILFQQFDDGDGRIRIEFTQRTEGDRIISEHHEYVLAKGWLIERDYDKKTEVDRQVAKPGEKINLLKLGQGPFPLPIGQDKAEVHNQFDVTLAPADKDDPKDTAHLVLIPKAGTDMARSFAQIDLWVDRQTSMPVRITTLDAPRETTRITDLSNLKLNQNLSDSDFALPKVEGWELTQEPFHQ